MKRSWFVVRGAWFGRGDKACGWNPSWEAASRFTTNDAP